MKEGELWFVRLKEFTPLVRCMIDEIAGNIVRVISLDGKYPIDEYYEVGKDMELVQRIEDDT